LIDILITNSFFLLAINIPIVEPCVQILKTLASKANTRSEGQPCSPIVELIYFPILERALRSSELEDATETLDALKSYSKELS
jgi:hypothetical protein